MKSQSFSSLQALSRSIGSGEVGKPRTAMPVRIRVVSSFFTEFLAEVLPALFLNRGMDASIYCDPFGSIENAIFSGSAALDEDFACTVLLSTSREIGSWPGLCDSHNVVRDLISKEVAAWQKLWETIDGPIVQLSYDTPNHRPLGLIDISSHVGRSGYVRRLNERLMEEAGDRVLFLDAESLAANVGTASWQDSRLFQMFRQPFAMDAIPALADAIAAGVQAKLHRGRKVLVLDLDNALWGGTIGDDGVSGILVGSDIVGGEAYSEFQSYIRALRERGVILAVCTKNQHELAMLPFQQHDGMALTMQDFASFIANFDDKATNIRKISRALNIGLEHFVFVDDSPVECELVRKTLVDVCVMELPESAEEFVGCLDSANLFPISAITTEDIQRTESYQLQKKFDDEPNTDLDGFLASLEAHAVFESLTEQNVLRVAQLLAKTNQFKLTSTIRHEAALRAAPDEVLSIRLVDRLQNYGVVSVILFSVVGEALEILNWVMSCRVFNRRLEQVALRELIRLAEIRSCSSIFAPYEELPTNHIMPGIVRSLGFAEASSGFEFDVTQSEENLTWPESHIHVVGCEVPTENAQGV